MFERIVARALEMRGAQDSKKTVAKKPARRSATREGGTKPAKR